MAPNGRDATVTQQTVDIQSLSPEELALIKGIHAAGIKTPQKLLNSVKTAQLNTVEFGEKFFYIPETGAPIHFEPVQQILLPIIEGNHNYPRLLPFYNTIEWSSIKKTGKTAVSGAYARKRAESSTLNDEILFFANDESQSRGRAYAAITLSIELNPLYDRVKRVLYDEDGNPLWRIIEDFLEHIPTATKVKAVNVDYRGEAGSNPTLTVWTEAWGYDTDKQVKLFDEMTPVLTREKSQRYLEGYAGYVGKSKVLQHVEQLATDPDRGGRQLTLDDIPDWPWQDESLLPIWVNDTAGLFAYLDRGMNARKRMPWLQGPEADKYYAQQALTLTSEQYDRLHLNMWVSPVTAFIPIEWHRACAEPTLPLLAPWREPITILTMPEPDLVDEQTGRKLLDMYMDPANWRVVGPATPCVLSADASVSGDCTALVMGRRHPARYQDAVLERAYVWTPPRNGKLDYEYTPNTLSGLSFKQQAIELCMRYNIVEFAYDEWQLHYLMTEFARAAMVWCRPFSQASPRDVADKQLYDYIKTRRYTYNPTNPYICHTDIEKHLVNSARKQRANEDTKLHIVKADSEGKIDLTIAQSMLLAEILRLDL